MKTAVEIPDALLTETKTDAGREGITLIEQAVPRFFLLGEPRRDELLRLYD